MLCVRVVWSSEVCQQGPATNTEEIIMTTPDNEVTHPTTKSQNTSLSNDDLVVRKSARCRMQGLVIAICKVLVIGSRAIG
jgi:hypothetical protein